MRSHKIGFYSNKKIHPKIINKISPYMPLWTNYIILAHIANFSTKYFILSKVFTDEGEIRLLYHGLSTCVGDNPLTKAHGLSPRTGRLTIV